MSDVQNTTVADAVRPEETLSATGEQGGQTTTSEAPAAESKPDETIAHDEAKNEAVPAEEKHDEAAATADKVVEPISEGQLAYKGPGLLKSLIPSKKEFWLDDEATSPNDLNSYMRGEKPEIAHPVVAWASQTGKGLLFFNKKGDTTHKQPGGVLALYDATDLKKQNPHEIIFKLNGHEHTLKATSDAERNGWYLSLEKAVEMGKASKDETRESEGYKAELEKLNKPHVAAVAAAANRSQSQPGKNTENDRAKRADSDPEEADKNKAKSRSTSRGVFNRLTGKKDEAEPKKEADKEISKPEDEHKNEEIAAATVGGAAVAGTGIAAAEFSNSDAKHEAVESPAEASKTDGKPVKRGSIFGKIGGWGASKTPTKEKDLKDAELKPEVPPKDDIVSENPPVLPETATTEHTDAEAEANKIEAKAEDETVKENQKEEDKEEVGAPSKEKGKFLSGLPFINKRNRSVSPSANKINSEAQAPKEEAAMPVTTEEAPTETAATTTAEPADKPVEKVEDPAKTETSTPNKRQSFIGSLGRRASKAMGGMRPPKKENVAPTTEANEHSAEAAATEDVPKVNGEAKSAEPEQPQTIGDVGPESIITSPPTVTASA